MTDGGLVGQPVSVDGGAELVIYAGVGVAGRTDLLDDVGRHGVGVAGGHDLLPHQQAVPVAEVVQEVALVKASAPSITGACVCVGGM